MFNLLLFIIIIIMSTNSRWPIVFYDRETIRQYKYSSNQDNNSLHKCISQINWCMCKFSSNKEFKPIYIAHEKINGKNNRL